MPDSSLVLCCSVCFLPPVAMSSCPVNRLLTLSPVCVHLVVVSPAVSSKVALRADSGHLAAPQLTEALANSRCLVSCVHVNVLMF